MATNKSEYRPILPLKLVAMAMSLEQSEKENPIFNL